MAEANLSVLLRNGTHHGDGRAGQGTLFYALKCENITINYGRTPIQIAIPQNTPELIDLGIVRPSISISGLVDNVGGDPTNTTDNDSGSDSTGEAFTTGTSSIDLADMAFLIITLTNGNDTITYFIPYKKCFRRVL